MKPGEEGRDVQEAETVCAALDDVAQVGGHCPANCRFSAGQGTCLSGGFGPHLGSVQEATDPCFSHLSHINVCLPLFLSPRLWNQ